MTTILHASGSAELLSSLPVLAGFTPAHSVVLVPFSGSRSAGVMRTDLPDDDVDPKGYAEAAVALVSRVASTDGVAIVIYSDPTDTSETPALPWQSLVLALRHRLAVSGLRVVDALCVTSSAWASYADDPPRWSALTDLPPAPTIPGLADVAGDQDAGVALPRIPKAERQRVATTVDALAEFLEPSRHRRTRPHSPAAATAARLLEDPPALFERLLDEPESDDPSVVTAILWCLERPLLRDTALMQWASDLETGRTTLTAQLAFAERGAMLPDHLGDLFLGHGPRPDTDRLRLALTAARFAAARAPRRRRPGPLTAAAWLSWALGRSSHADAYLRLVREIDPTHRLAALLSTMLDAAMLPEWAFRPEGC